MRTRQEESEEAVELKESLPPGWVRGQMLLLHPSQCWQEFQNWESEKQADETKHQSGTLVVSVLISSPFKTAVVTGVLAETAESDSSLEVEADSSVFYEPLMTAGSA